MESHAYFNQEWVITATTLIQIQIQTLLYIHAHTHIIYYI
jgi:hypothetical protein